MHIIYDIKHSSSKVLTLLDPKAWHTLDAYKWRTLWDHFWTYLLNDAMYILTFKVTLTPVCMYLYVF